MKFIYQSFILLCFMVATLACTSGNTDEQEQPKQSESNVRIVIDSSNGNKINVKSSGGVSNIVIDSGNGNEINVNQEK